MDRRLLVVIGTLLVVASGAFVPIAGATSGSAQSASGYPSPAAVCQGIDATRAVGVFPTGDRLEPSETLYPGTAFRILVCSDGDPEPRGTAWSFRVPKNGLTVTRKASQYVTVEVTDAQAKIEIPAHIRKKPNIEGPTVVVQNGWTARVKPADATVQFPDRATRNEYRDAQSKFLTTASEIRTAARTINRTAQAVRSGTSNVTIANDTYAALNQTQAMTSSRGRAESALFAAATAGTDPAALSYASALRDRGQATKTTARQALRAYISALEARESSARDTVLFNFALTFLVGGIVGGALGWWRTRSNLSEVAYDRLFRSLEYSLDQMKFPLAAAVLILLVTVAAVVALSGLDTLLHAL